jgi:hypothetical protein
MPVWSDKYRRRAAVMIRWLSMSSSVLLVGNVSFLKYAVSIAKADRAYTYLSWGEE